MLDFAKKKLITFATLVNDGTQKYAVNLYLKYIDIEDIQKTAIRMQKYIFKLLGKFIYACCILITRTLCQFLRFINNDGNMIHNNRFIPKREF